MSEPKSLTNGTTTRWFPFVLMLILGCGGLLLAASTWLWALSALPVGLAFGFVLQKGDLCGASAFSEVLMLRDARKLGGIWLAIACSMVLFALAGQLGWMQIQPKPFLWMSYLTGGLVFGVGTVLAGGCVSGCLYKSAAGNLNSIVALLGMPVGIAAVESGPLAPLSQWMKRFAISGPDGQSVSLSTLTGLPFWLLALILFGLTLSAFCLMGRRRPADGRRRGFRAFLAGPWRAWQAGIALGVVALLAAVSAAAAGRSYPLGVTHGVLNLHQVITERNLVHDWGAPRPAVNPGAKPVPQSVGQLPPPAKPPVKKVSWWLILVVLGTLYGAYASASLAGPVRLKGREPLELVVAIAGGLLVGVGAALSSGCVVGNILSGWALMSVGLVLFGLAVVAGNWLATHFYLMGGSLADLPLTLGSIFRRR